jgi:hypothetical protein
MTTEAVKAASVTSVNIRPEVTILSVLQHLNYRPWFALAEFVDNALDSFLRCRKALAKANGGQVELTVAIEMDSEAGGRIVVRDNAGGILESEFPRAFRPAELPPDRSGLSEFGMGMKSAACWFARKWEVRTSAFGEAVERTVSFDINKIVNEKSDRLPVKVKPIAAGAHFTEVSMWDLQHPPKGRTIAKIKEHLASIYRVYLRSGTLKLTFNGDLLKYDEAAVLKAPPFNKPTDPAVEWRKAINFDFGNGQSVRGFAALRENASTAYAGLALFRRNRLIQGSGDEPYRPQVIFGNPNSYRYQRLFGELHLEGFEVSHTKDGFRWEEHEEVFLKRLKQELEKEPLNLLEQAEGYRAKQSKKNIEAAAQKATDHVAYAVENGVGPLLAQEPQLPASPQPLPPEVHKSLLEASTRTVNLTAGSQQWEITIRTTVDPAVGPWLRLGEQTRRQAGPDTIRCIAIDVALAHPFTQQVLGANHENLELFLRFAAAIALALMMAAAGGGGPPQFALHHLNSLLRDALSQP